MKKEVIPVSLEEIEEAGEFNNWRGVIGLYFSSTRIRPLKKYGVTPSMWLIDARNILLNQIK